jgi:zinc protease
VLASGPMHVLRFLRAAGLALAGLSTAAQASAFDLPVQQSKLPNGLTVIVHEDHVLPVVAANIIYRVGSKDEQPGRTGFAHLFEHLMFMGTRRAPAKAFDAWMEAAGGSNNAWTSADFTDYHELGPSTLLPLFLWLEADRLETLGGEIDKPKLDLQRDVVRNERRQTIENQPYGMLELRMPELMYPESHPYHHPVIGSHADLEAAGVDDVKTFFARNYRTGNAALVVAGDVPAADVNKLAAQYFGHLPGLSAAQPASTPPLPIPPPALGKVVRETMQDRVEMTKIVMAFHSPAHFQPGDAELDLLGSVLSSGKTSRLYKRLVYDQALAQSVHAYQESSVLSSIFTIEVLVRPGVDPDAVEKATDAVLTELSAHGPTAEELQRAKNQVTFDFVQNLQSLAARARLLNMYWAEKGDADYLARDLARYDAATVAAVQSQAQKTLTLGSRAIVRVVPPIVPGSPHAGAAPAPREAAPKATNSAAPAAKKTEKP